VYGLIIILALRPSLDPDMFSKLEQASVVDSVCNVQKVSLAAARYVVEAGVNSLVLHVIVGPFTCAHFYKVNPFH